jgi:cytidylate kinase
MNKASPYVITISRQLGSGGAYLGQRLAMRLNALYLDHEIVRQAAQELKIPEEYLVFRDEKVTSRWQSILQSFAGSTSWSYVPPPLDILNDAELYNVESDIITRIANQRTAVIVGRGSCYVLRQHPRSLSVFLHANIQFRQQRVQDLYHVSAQQALKLINSIDQERARYLRALTGQDWLDARQYHLSLDTSAVGLDKAEAIILETIQARFGDIKLGSQEVAAD